MKLGKRGNFIFLGLWFVSLWVWITRRIEEISSFSLVFTQYLLYDSTSLQPFWSQVSFMTPPLYPSHNRKAGTWDTSGTDRRPPKTCNLLLFRFRMSITLLLPVVVLAGSLSILIILLVIKKKGTLSYLLTIISSIPFLYSNIASKNVFLCKVVLSSSREESTSALRCNHMYSTIFKVKLVTCFNLL